MAEQADRAIEQGRRLAERVMEARHRRRALRRVAVQREPAPHARALEEAAPESIIAELRAELGPPSSRVLIAEGDSWFDYPFTDVLEELEDHHGYDIESVSSKGDTIEEMAYSGGQLDDLARAIEKVVRNGRIPEAILLSGGGNDVAGDEFAVLLNHSSSANRGLNEQVVAGVVDERIRDAYLTVITSVTEVCQQSLGVALPILVHGYDFAVPDGRGFWGGWGPLPGPWLQPGFSEKGYGDFTENKGIVRTLINRLNTMLETLPSLPGLGHVRFIDLRNTLSSADHDYQDWWSNELHPTEAGFEAIAAKFVAGLS